MSTAGYPQPPGEFARLDRAESLQLLARVPVGRLIFTMNALPAVRLVNFAVAGEMIVLRTAGDSTIARKVDQAIVAFEVDELDAATCSGWSVTVTGRAEVVTDPEIAARYESVPLAPWAPGSRDQFITITTDLAEGLRVGRIITHPLG
jgi:nitroimidazol reductase NimA-like FMN-containing flavoprotein (pyridoxamine 5'-phosphate oxidase superfamily)